ncbi:MAG: hypothetical protein C6W58_11350 [Bacillaceae bacterium]|uniref:Uncharacterized protein n=1 Tax=Aeribacillus pallidus TaxID=33936 RepID=A0A223E3V3_9BACI|nr:hypothetical protein AP3564_06100 [Aeribacillus pallidus]REJ15542.1 MAG: hypothetical protein C6W58_11350 [Bacillaceae bacterium]
MIFLHSTQSRSKKMFRHIKGDLQMILAGGRVWNCGNSSQHPENMGPHFQLRQESKNYKSQRRKTTHFSLLASF